MPHYTKWTIDKITSGLQEFLKTNGRYPTALEIDKFGLLPSSRQIQRKYGGLIKLRKSLGFPDNEVNLNVGVKRSATAKAVGQRGKIFEKEIYTLLVAKFGEIFIHEQKPFGNYSQRLDFFVYCKNYKFGVDVFYANDTHSLIGCINLKYKTYKDVNFDIVLLFGNKILQYENVSRLMSVKKNQLPNNFRVLDVNNFKKFIDTLEPLKIL